MRNLTKMLDYLTYLNLLETAEREKEREKRGYQVTK